MKELALAVSILVNAYLIYLLFDASISLEYSRMEQNFLHKRTLLSIEAINFAWRGRTLEEVDDFGNQAAMQGVIYKRDSSIITVGDIQFLLSKGIVSSVNYLSESN